MPSNMSRLAQEGLPCNREANQCARSMTRANPPSECLPREKARGFLWAMNSYWRMEERDGGVYVECEAITLSRGVPLGLGMLVNPMLQSFAEESLKNTLEAKRQAVRSKQ